MMRPIWSPTVSGSSRPPPAQARMPRPFHIRAYSATRSSTAIGIAPSEWLIRYVVCSRIGKRSRYSSSSVIATSPLRELLQLLERRPHLVVRGRLHDRPGESRSAAQLDVERELHRRSVAGTLEIEGRP